MTRISEEELKRNVADKDTLLRLLYMMVFAVAFYLAAGLLFFIATVQFFMKLLTGRVLNPLLGFGINLSAYLGQIAQYLSYASHDKPFPFGPFPNEVMVEIMDANRLGEKDI